MPSTSTYRAAQGVVFEDEEEDDDEDVSLLATPIAAEPDVEGEDEIDDDSLLAAEMVLEAEKTSSAEARLVDMGMVTECGKKETREADYLEGMTAEMFGDDGDFEEEVEPLPDTHFGLLGSRKVLLQPQGCIDDLPEEVLREVLCLLPAPDLFRNVSLVCHRWRNIVLDPKVRQINLNPTKMCSMFTYSPQRCRLNENKAGQT